MCTQTQKGVGELSTGQWQRRKYLRGNVLPVLKRAKELNGTEERLLAICSFFYPSDRGKPFKEMKEISVGAGKEEPLSSSVLSP